MAFMQTLIKLIIIYEVKHFENMLPSFDIKVIQGPIKKDIKGPSVN